MQLDAILLDHWAAEDAPDGAAEGTMTAPGLIAELRLRRPALPILMLTAADRRMYAVKRAPAT